MAQQSLESLFDDIVKDYKAVATEAIEKAAIKAQNDIMEKAYSCLEKYYSNYKPKKYKRHGYLKRAIVPVLIDQTTRRKIAFRVGVKYDKDNLVGLYKSNSRFHQSGDEWRSRGMFYGSDKYLGPLKKPHDQFNFDGSDNGIPEPEWILNNFLRGVHPWVKQRPDKEWSDSMMEKFFDDELSKKIEAYMEEELIEAIYRRLGLG